MKAQLSTPDVQEIKQRMEALSTFLIGTVSIPLGVLWVVLGVVDALYIVERRLPYFEEDPVFSLFIHIVQLGLLAPASLGTVLVGVLLFIFYRRKIGICLPHLEMPKRYAAFGAIVVSIIAVLLIVHYAVEPVFPWLGIMAIGVFYSVAGAFGKPRRWYYPAIALAMTGVCFLPLLLGGDGLWMRVVCFLAYALTLLCLGMLDHRNLMRLHRSLLEAADGQTV
jgi:hypothetical protein